MGEQVKGQSNFLKISMKTHLFCKQKYIFKYLHTCTYFDICNTNEIQRLFHFVGTFCILIVLVQNLLKEYLKQDCFLLDI